MAKPSKSLFVCQACGATASRWQGKCAACDAWNTLVEETDAGPAPGSGITRQTKGRVVRLESLKGSTDEAPRFSTGIGELDRVTGGGIVPGSALLIGGEPGIGKSTLLLQLTANLARAGRRALYFSGEEAIAQVRLRAERLGLADAPVGLASETNLSNISSSSILSKRFGPTRSTLPPARSARSAPPPNRSSDMLKWRAAPCCSSVTLPRTARSPDPR
jgi:DNA repair protein RadA/Sms